MDNQEDDFLESYEDDTSSVFTEEPKKEKFLNKILNFIARKQGHSMPDFRNLDDDSVFENIAKSADKSLLTRENHLQVREAVDLSEEALKLFKQKLIFLNKSRNTNSKISQMEIFNKISPKDIDYLKMILNRYQSLIKERNVIDAQLQSFSKNVVHLLDVLDDANEHFEKIVDAEKTQRIFRQDLNHIEGEKEELLEEMETLIIGRDFFKKFSMGFILVSVVATTILSFLGIFYEYDIFMPIFFLIVTVIGVGTFVFYTRNKISKKMKLNIAFQKRAVELLNKKNVVYAYYTNFLNFEYNKYKVNSSMELRQNLREVEFYKQTLKRSNNVRSVVRESEIEIYEFLDKNKIKINTSLLRFAESVNIEERRREFDNLHDEKGKLEAILSELDEKYELVISRLSYLSENDNTSTKIICDIVNAFYVESEKLVKEFE